MARIDYEQGPPPASAQEGEPDAPAELVRDSGLFDAGYYAAQRPDLPAELDQAIAHYLDSGWREGLDPGPGFDTRYYLDVNDDVAEEGVNPLLHYLKYGKAEGRLPTRHPRTAGVPPVAPPTAPSDDEWKSLAASWPAGGAAAVDVLVPVYAGRDETLRCLYSVLAAVQTTPYRLVVIDDCSPEPALVEALQGLAQIGLIELHRTPRNLGFVGACNLGMGLHPDRDVVLLNSDTEVHGDWLDRLRAAALREPRIATVTPLSNNAEICSYPVFCRDNRIDLGLTDAELDRLAAQVNRGRSVELPTGVGFCLYVRRECLAQIGLFDEAKFGRGYGEENDLCRRAVAAGWRNVLAADVFVRHYGAVSFGAAKLERVRRALATLERLHPGYGQLIGRFIAADPVHTFREALDTARLIRRGSKGAFLFVTHTFGGGTERHTRELAAALEAQGAPVFFCREALGRQGRIRIEDPRSPDAVNLPEFELAHDLERFAGYLQQLGVRHVHVHQLAGMAPIAPEFFATATRLAGCSYDVTLHDYLPICPRVNLVDSAGVYCAEPSTSVCETCLMRSGSRYGEVSVWLWRQRWAEFLAGARRVFAPDEDVALRMERYAPGASFTVRPHAHTFSPCRAASPAPRGGPRRVAVLGAIGPEKGSVLLRDTAAAAKAASLPLEFVVVGFTDRDAELRALGNVQITGRYPESEAVERLIEAEPTLAWFPAVWPETFSFTLSAVLEAGVFPVVFDMGAPARRLKRLGWGAIWPMEAMLDPEALAHRLVNQRLSPPPEGLHEALGARRYGDPFTDYYELEPTPR